MTFGNLLEDTKFPKMTFAKPYRLRRYKTLKNDRRVIESYFLILPITILACITTYPLVYAVIASFRNLVFGKYLFVGLANYWRLIVRGRFVHSLYITIVFTSTAVVVEVTLGMLIALLYSERLPGVSVLRVLLILPMVATPIVVAMIFRHFIYPPDTGILNYFLDLIRLPMLKLKWHCDTRTALLSLILVAVWEKTSFPFLVFLAGIKSLPKEPYEAASIDGASSLQKFFHITLPMLRRIIMVVIVFRTIASINKFDIFYGLTEGGPGLATENLSVFIYLEMFKYNRMGTSSAASIVAMFMTFCFVFIIYKAILGKES